MAKLFHNLLCWCSTVVEILFCLLGIHVPLPTDVSRIAPFFLL